MKNGLDALASSLGWVSVLNPVKGSMLASISPDKIDKTVKVVPYIYAAALKANRELWVNILKRRFNPIKTQRISSEEFQRLNKEWAEKVSRTYIKLLRKIVEFRQSLVEPV